MWNVSSEKMGVDLPSGFFLKEDSHFVCLFHQSRPQYPIARFNAQSVDPKVIEREAKRFLRN